MRSLTLGARAQVLADTAERIALLNEFRTDDFQDEVVRVVNDAREHWRDENGDLPRRGSDRMLDALLQMADISDGSQETVRDACGKAMREAEDARVAR